MQVACAPSTAEPFLTSTIHWLGCSGQRIGALGFAGLGADGGPAAALVTAGLTIAIALFGLRLMFGDRLGFDVPLTLFARVAIVFLLAFSWPAARTLFFDVAFGAPAQIANAISGSDRGAPLLAQLQSTDNSIQALTAWGTGREELNAVRTVSGQPAAQAFSSVAVSDRLALGMARVAFLSTSVLVMGGLPLVAGLLFAILPLLAVFYLFRPSEGIVIGWLRAMLAVTLSSAIGAVLLALEASLALPWLVQRTGERAQGLATPNAPTELLVIVGTTATIALISTVLIARLCFAHFPLAYRGVGSAGSGKDGIERSTPATVVQSYIGTPSREVALAGSVSRLAIRETRAGAERSSSPETVDIGRDAVSSLTRSPLHSRHQLRQSRAARMRSGNQ